MSENAEHSSRKQLQWIINEYVVEEQKAELLAELEQLSDSDVADAMATLQGIFAARRLGK